MKRGEWTRLRVVVEVPVQTVSGHSFTARDLTWYVRRALDSYGIHKDQRLLPEEIRPRFGRFEVKDFARVRK